MKNKFIAILVTVVTILSSVCLWSGAEDIKLGDVNKDGKVNATDARFVLRVSAQLETLDEADVIFADVNFDGKVNAIDARTILRAAAQIETLPELPTKEPDTEPTEPDTEPTEPDTEPTKPEEPEQNTGVVVDTYPDAIDTFLSGTFYLEAESGSADEATLKIATKGKNYEFISEFEGSNMSIMFYNNKLHFKTTTPKGDKIYTIFDDDAIKAIESMTGQEFDLNFDEMLQGFSFGTIEVKSKAVLTKGEYNDEECDIYTFEIESGSIEFTIIDDQVKCIRTLNADGVQNSIIKVKTLSAKIPTTMLSTKGYTKKNILAFFTSLM